MRKSITVAVLSVALMAPVNALAKDFSVRLEGFNIDDYRRPRPIRHHRKRNHLRYASYLGDPRPRAWCGWALRQWLGVIDRRFNLAREWAHWGSRAFGPAPGVVVVWPHHVGIIVAPADSGRWMVKSGNDGHMVRSRPRSVAGAIAFRSNG